MNSTCTNWDSNGNLTSTKFDDIYFSRINGLAESNYVFINGNNLEERFSKLAKDDEFYIGELGFGTGLNFFSTCLAFNNYAPKGTKLVFNSIEKFPLAPKDIAKAIQRWDVLSPLLSLFLEQYAKLSLHEKSTGIYTLQVGNITLNLYIGDVKGILPSLTSLSDGNIDCWFLDGFNPSTNPQMWSESLWPYMYEQTKKGGTFATFTAAGFVRRGLEKAGFEVARIKGFGHKRHMSIGIKP